MRLFVEFTGKSDGAVPIARINHYVSFHSKEEWRTTIENGISAIRFVCGGQVSVSVEVFDCRSSYLAHLPMVMFSIFENEAPSPFKIDGIGWLIHVPGSETTK